MISQGAVLDIARDAIYTILITSAPLLLVSLVVGLIISINVSSGTYYFACDRSDRQHFSDRYVNPGADTYVCSKDYCGICCNDPLRLLDVK